MGNKHLPHTSTQYQQLHDRPKFEAMAVKVEVCATSYSEAMAAVQLGCDSVELCSWLACGGLTPSSGFVDTVRSTLDIAVRVLVRPTPEGFVFAPPEANTLLVDCEVFGGGALDIVTGALTSEGIMDTQLMQAVQRSAPESRITFHRAIDRASDPIRLAEQCVELDIHRILTSGGAFQAIDGVDVIKAIMNATNGNCEIALAAGINGQNVVELVERTGAQEVHFSAQKKVDLRSEGVALSSLGGKDQFGTCPDVAKIEGVLNALVKAGLR